MVRRFKQMKMYFFSLWLTLSLLSCLAHAQPTEKITISGQVTNKSGQPVNQCDVYFNKNAWIDAHSIHVQCDDQGRYFAEITKGHYNSVYVCDEARYGIDKLEFWAWNVTFESSQTLNAQFDSLEVYSLAAWASNGGSNTIFASFRPMSLQKAKEAKHTTFTHHQQQAILFDIAPKIEAGSIKGYIDEQALELISYSWAYEKVAECGKLPKSLDDRNGCFMPMIIAQFKKPPLKAGKHTLKIDLVDAKNGDFGQAISHFTANERGLGF